MQQAENTELEAIRHAEEEAAKQARVQQLEIAMKDLQERINTANKGKLLRSLPESRKCGHDEDSEDILAGDPLNEDTVEQMQPQPMLKIPKKATDLSACFNTADEHITFVPGWQPIARGSGLLITMPKSFKEKIWRNKFFSYRELHNAMNRPKTSTSTSLKSIFDKLIEQEEISILAEKDSMQLLDLNIYQLQFSTLYSQMYPQHTVSHMEHQLTLYTLIQQHKPLVQVLDYDDHVRKHFIRQTGEPWVSSDPVFTWLADAILANTRFEQERHQRKPNHSNHFTSKNKTAKPFHKAKPKATGSGTGRVVCFAFNGMSKNVATCTRSNCSYPHKCAHCKRPHRNTECDKLK